jgi:hypothetical protein
MVEQHDLRDHIDHLLLDPQLEVFPARHEAPSFPLEVISFMQDTWKCEIHGSSR